MTEFFQKLFSTEDFPPRWHCGNWAPELGWLHILSDVAIFAAYAAIPLALTYYIRQRKDTHFIPLFWLFAAFIFACGTGHLIEATLFWHPWYRLSGAVKLVTAIVSWATVVQVIKILPKALALPGLVLTNRQLEAEIRERKQAEERSAMLNTALEERARRLEAANLELESFSYSISHDLRAPLRGIDSFSQMVIEDYGPKLDTEGQRQLNVIRSEAQRMGQLIDELLSFSRLGRQEIKLATFDMTALAQSVFDGLPAAARERVKEFRLHPLPAAYGDPALIRQLFINLLSNAVKYSAPAEAPVIEVSGETVDGISTYRVKDNGVGFDQRYAHKLFGVFQRLHAEHEFEGTGVGLAIVQRVIHRHGGTVAAEGVLNHGATFSFSLPIKNQTNLQAENGNHD